MNIAAQKYIKGDSAVKIVDSVETAIRDGHLRHGDPLPTVRSLAMRLRVSPATVASAYRALRTRGLLVAEGRRGTRVSHRPPLATRAAVSFPPHARNLANGNPDPRLLPSLAGALAASEPRPHLYAETASLPELLSLAGRQFAADGVPDGSSTVVGGALDGIERVLQAHLRPGDRVAVEDPGFTRVFDLLHALALVPLPVRVDDGGPRPEELERALGAGARGLIVTPRAQNPTGAAIDPPRARELRLLLRESPDVLVVEDDHAGAVSGAPPVTLVERERTRWAVVRSVSKSLGPDLRLAVIAGDATTIARVEGRQLLGTGWVSHILQHLVVALWSDRSTARLLRVARGAYATRRKALLEALARRGIPARGRSGLNVWVPVPEEARTLQLLLEAGWGVAGGERFRLGTPPALRVTIATLGPEEAERFATDLARILAPERRTHSA